MSRVLILGGYAESLVNFRGSLIQTMVNGGHEVIAAAPAMDEHTAHQLEKLGARPLTVHIERAGINPLADLLSTWRLFRMLREIKPDVLLSYTIKPVIYGTLAARLAGIRNRHAMITGLGNGLGGGRSLSQRTVAAIIRILCRLSLRGCGGVLFQNPDDQRFFLDKGLIRKDTSAVVVAGSGVDLDYFSPAPLPEHPSYLMIARLLVDKGLREYVSAARILRAKYGHAAFRLVGWIDDTSDAVRQDELDGWVREGTLEYLGRLRDVRPAIAEAGVYVLPSYYPEGVPRTCLEAMAMGRPIITTDTPGCRETVMDGVNGFLVTPRSVEGLVAAMERFINEPQLAQRMGQESIRLAHQRFDVRLVNQQMLGAMGLDS